jgi:hypothetical protein
MESYHRDTCQDPINSHYDLDPSMCFVGYQCILSPVTSHRARTGGIRELSLIGLDAHYPSEDMRCSTIER